MESVETSSPSLSLKESSKGVPAVDYDKKAAFTLELTKFGDNEAEIR